MGLQRKGDRWVRHVRRAMVSMWYAARVRVVDESGVAHMVSDWRDVAARGVDCTCTGLPPSAADILVGRMYVDGRRSLRVGKHGGRR